VRWSSWPVSANRALVVARPHTLVAFVGAIETGFHQVVKMDTADGQRITPPMRLQGDFTIPFGRMRRTCA